LFFWEKYRKIFERLLLKMILMILYLSCKSLTIFGGREVLVFEIQS